MGNDTSKLFGREAAILDLEDPDIAIDGKPPDGTHGSRELWLPATNPTPTTVTTTTNNNNNNNVAVRLALLEQVLRATALSQIPSTTTTTTAQMENKHHHHHHQHSSSSSSVPPPRRVPNLLNISRLALKSDSALRDVLRVLEKEDGQTIATATATPDVVMTPTVLMERLFFAKQKYVQDLLDTVATTETVMPGTTGGALARCQDRSNNNNNKAGDDDGDDVMLSLVKSLLPGKDKQHMLLDLLLKPFKTNNVPSPFSKFVFASGGGRGGAGGGARSRGVIFTAEFALDVIEASLSAASTQQKQEQQTRAACGVLLAHICLSRGTKLTTALRALRIIHDMKLLTTEVFDPTRRYDLDDVTRVAAIGWAVTCNNKRDDDDTISSSIPSKESVLSTIQKYLPRDATVVTHVLSHDRQDVHVLVLEKEQRHATLWTIPIVDDNNSNNINPRRHTLTTRSQSSFGLAALYGDTPNSCHIGWGNSSSHVLKATKLSVPSSYTVEMSFCPAQSRHHSTTSVFDSTTTTINFASLVRLQTASGALISEIRYYYQTHTVSVHMRDDDNSNNKGICHAMLALPPPLEWYRVALSMNSSTMSCTLYVNGIPRSTATELPTTTVPTNAVEVLLGGSFHGSLANVRLHSRACGPDEIRRPTHDVLAWWPLQEGVGRVGYDYGAAGRHMLCCDTTALNWCNSNSDDDNGVRVISSSGCTGKGIALPRHSLTPALTPEMISTTAFTIIEMRAAPDGVHVLLRATDGCWYCFELADASDCQLVCVSQTEHGGAAPPPRRPPDHQTLSLSTLLARAMAGALLLSVPNTPCKEFIPVPTYDDVLDPEALEHCLASLLLLENKNNNNDDNDSVDNYALLTYAYLRRLRVNGLVPPVAIHDRLLDMVAHHQRQQQPKNESVIIAKTLVLAFEMGLLFPAPHDKIKLMRSWGHDGQGDVDEEQRCRAHVLPFIIRGALDSFSMMRDLFSAAIQPSLEGMCDDNEEDGGDQVTAVVLLDGVRLGLTENESKKWTMMVQTLVLASGSPSAITSYALLLLRRFCVQKHLSTMYFFTALPVAPKLTSAALNRILSILKSTVLKHMDEKRIFDSDDDVAAQQHKEIVTLDSVPVECKRVMALKGRSQQATTWQVQLPEGQVLSHPYDDGTPCFSIVSWTSASSSPSSPSSTSFNVYVAPEATAIDAKSSSLPEGEKRAVGTEVFFCAFTTQ
eukprot:PhM_4_TR11290/c1_g1_i1/m.93284